MKSNLYRFVNFCGIGTFGYSDSHLNNSFCYRALTIFNTKVSSNCISNDNFINSIFSANKFQILFNESIDIYCNMCRWLKARYEIYHGKDGLVERQDTIKEYLASFTGGKKNPNYIEYDRLIKGR